MQTRDDSIIQLQKRILVAIGFVVLIALFSLVISPNIPRQFSYETLSVSSNATNSTAGERIIPLAEVEASHRESVYISGEPIGIAITARGLIVIEEGGIQTANGEQFPARDAGIQKGDIIKSLNGEAVSSIYQVKKILAEAKLDALTIEYKRDGRIIEGKIVPAQERITGQKKLGVALKEDVGGIGTLTFITKKGQFGALGHFISDADSGLDEELDGGNIYRTSIDDVVKGEIGRAGGLVASVNRLSNSIGKIEANTNIGLYGVYTAKASGQQVRVAMKGEAKPGHALMLTTVGGDTPKLYDIEIVKVISQSEPGDKGMVILVKDKELLQKTGGIVQGMSGSPILQDGVLVGAVTHVFIQDPTRGYAVHARFMLEEADKIAVSNNNVKIDNLSLPNIDDIDLAA